MNINSNRFADISTTPLDDTASACNNCGTVSNKHDGPCHVCRSTSGQTLITMAPSIGIHS